MEENETDDENRRVLMRGSGNGQHVVKRHRHVGNHDLPGGLGKGFARRAAGNRLVLVDVFVFKGLNGINVVFGACAQFTPHLPAHPEQQHATHQQQAQDLEELRGHQGEDDAQHRSGDNAHQNGLVALFFRQARCRKTNDNGIVTRQHEVDHDDLAKGHKSGLGKEFCEQVEDSDVVN